MFGKGFKYRLFELGNKELIVFPMKPFGSIVRLTKIYLSILTAIAYIGYKQNTFIHAPFVI